VVLFCIGGLRITEPDYRLYFSWPGFVALHAAIIALLFRCTGGVNEEMSRGNREAVSAFQA